MALEHFARLVEMHRGDRSVRQLERDAGKRYGWISSYLRPSTPPLQRLPRAEKMRALAAVLDVPYETVLDAFQQALYTDNKPTKIYEFIRDLVAHCDEADRLDQQRAELKARARELVDYTSQ